MTVHAIDDRTFHNPRHVIPGRPSAVMTPYGGDA